MTATKKRPYRRAPLGGALSDRELQALLLIAKGLSNREIGRELYLSEDTVKTHNRGLFAKLGARDRAHAVALGYQRGVLRTTACSCQRGAGR